MCLFHVQLIQNKFSEFQLGIEAGSQRFERVDKMATALVEEENPKSTLILERQEDLRYSLLHIPVMLTVIMIIAGTVQMREESESEIRK